MKTRKPSDATRQPELLSREFLVSIAKYKENSEKIALTQWRRYGNVHNVFFVHH